MLESRFNSLTVLLSILKTTEQGFEVLHPEVWFLKWLKRGLSPVSEAVLKYQDKDRQAF